MGHTSVCLCLSQVTKPRWGASLCSCRLSALLIRIIWYFKSWNAQRYIKQPLITTPLPPAPLGQQRALWWQTRGGPCRFFLTVPTEKVGRQSLLQSRRETRVLPRADLELCVDSWTTQQVLGKRPSLNLSVIVCEWTTVCMQVASGHVFLLLDFPPPLPHRVPCAGQHTVTTHLYLSLCIFRHLYKRAYLGNLYYKKIKCHRHRGMAHNLRAFAALVQTASDSVPHPTGQLTATCQVQFRGIWRHLLLPSGSCTHRGTQRCIELFLKNYVHVTLHVTLLWFAFPHQRAQAYSVLYNRGLISHGADISNLIRLFFISIVALVYLTIFIFSPGKIGHYKIPTRVSWSSSLEEEPLALRIRVS